MPDAVPRPHRGGVQPQTATRGRVRGVLLPLRSERTAAAAIEACEQAMKQIKIEIYEEKSGK